MNEVVKEEEREVPAFLQPAIFAAPSVALTHQGRQIRRACDHLYHSAKSNLLGLELGVLFFRRERQKSTKNIVTSR